MGFLSRLLAMIIKETLQLRRDRLTFAMMFGIPIMQLLLFGFAINNDPKGLPTAILSSDESAITRALVSAIGNTGYFSLTHLAANEAEVEDLLQRGEVQFVITVPGGFTRKLVRREAAQIAIEADATDPATIANALAAVNQAASQTLARELRGPLSYLRAGQSPVEVLLHRRYNPEGITRYNVVPGLLVLRKATIDLSSPPTSDQFLVFPLNIPASCSFERVVTGRSYKNKPLPHLDCHFFILPFFKAFYAVYDIETVYLFMYKDLAFGYPLIVNYCLYPASRFRIVILFGFLLLHLINKIRKYNSSQQLQPSPRH